MRLRSRVVRCWSGSSSWMTPTGQRRASTGVITTGLGYAVQLMTVRHLGRFLPDVLDVPAVVVDYVAEQVGAADPSCLKQYVERRATRFEHQAEIVTVYGYVSFATARDELAGVAGRSGVDQRGRAACAVLRGGAVAASAAGAAASASAARRARPGPPRRTPPTGTPTATPVPPRRCHRAAWCWMSGPAPARPACRWLRRPAGSSRSTR